MSAHDWRASAALGYLRDSVASDRLVLFTGAGVSFGLKRAADPARSLPGWVELLRELFGHLGPRLDSTNRDDCDGLLAATPGSRHLIEAASILRRADSSLFDSEVERMTTPETDTYTPAHDQLLKLEPRGIITLNYDTGHEAACRARRLDLALLTQESEGEFAHWLQSDQKKLFVLKAHGSIMNGPLILSGESYREVLTKRPAYRAFLQYALTHFHWLIVGFGMDDPDFSVFVNTLAESFGSPVQSHVAIKRFAEKSREEILLRRKYGIHTLYVNDWNELPEVFEEAVSAAGPMLLATLEMCLDPAMDRRGLGHSRLRDLGAAGRGVASRELQRRAGAAGNNFELAEICYALGFIDARANKQFLMTAVDSTQSAAVAGRALTILRPVLEREDVPKIRAWLKRFRKTPPAGRNPERIAAYLRYLLVYVPNKYRSGPDEDLT
jgi:hypothetical protein